MAAAPAPGEWTPLLDECIMLKVLEPGDGEGPEPKDTAICSYVARLRDTRRVFLEETGARFTIGEGETTMGLELALRHMCVNERALVVVDPKYAHGPLGRKRISPEEVEVPPDTWVEYDVTLHRTVFLPDADVAEKVAHGQYLKTKGNDHFRRQELREALRSYGTALKLLGGEATDNPTALTLVVDCHNNAAAVLGKQEEWNKAKEAIVEALSLAPDNVRSLTRAADIAMALADWEEAEMAWSHALEVAPDCAAAKEGLARLAKKREEYRRKERAMYGGKLNRPANVPPAAPAPTEPSDTAEPVPASGGDSLADEGPAAPPAPALTPPRPLSPSPAPAQKDPGPAAPSPPLPRSRNHVGRKAIVQFLVGVALAFALAAWDPLGNPPPPPPPPR